jgi:Ca2+ transporting ATPase
MLFEQLEDTILRILICAAIISLTVGMIQDQSKGWLEGTAILIAVVIVVSVATTNDYMKDLQFRKLNSQTETHMVHVVRGRKDMQISSNELVVGDVVQIFSGSMILADGILVRGHGITVDESSITGESVLIRKDISRAGDETHTNPFLISGSTVSEGKGSMIVCAVGNNSTLGQNRQMLNISEDETPLQQKLDDVAADIGKLGFAAASLILVALLIYISIDAGERGTWDGKSWTNIINAFILAITIIVVAVPEGLPLAVTLSLAYSVIKMKDEQNFVRHLRACETMGSATDILTDKTGTLTMNKMTVTRAYFFGQEYAPSCEGLHANHKDFITENISRNSTGCLTTEPGHMSDIGNRTECSLLRMAYFWGNNYNQYRDLDKELHVFAFSHVTKRMTTIYKESDKLKVYTKGAPEIILGLCSKIYVPSGDNIQFTPDHKAHILSSVNEFTSQYCLRVLALAYREAKNEDGLKKNGEFDMTNVEKDLVFIGFVGIEDPIRPEAAAAVAKVQKAGITVRMVTGDATETAIYIARSAGIIPIHAHEDEVRDYVMEGSEFRQRIGELIPETDEDGNTTGYQIQDMREFKNIAKNVLVLARCSPQDKLSFVIGLKNLGHVVAVTGDGSNDAPALKKSDVGLAMMTGTAMAKESADIILLDDNFQSLANSVKWGRNVYASIRKFLQFQLTVNAVALITSVAGSVATQTSPLDTIQMLWVNLIMDSLAALALATEAPSEDLFKGKPHGREDYIINKDMWVMIISQSLYQVTVLMIILFLGPWIFDVQPGWEEQDYSSSNVKHFTIFFHTFILMQLFNEINCRKHKLSELNVFKGFFSNKMFIIILVMTLAVHFVIIEFGGEPFKTTHLEWHYHLICIALGAVSLLVALLVKLSYSLCGRNDFTPLEDKETKQLLQ